MVTPFADECLTMSGPSSGMKCIFPFTWRGETYDACTREASTASNGDPWCSTKVDDDGVHISGQGNWGGCSQACPVKEGCECVIPFLHLGVTHNACTMHDSLWMTGNNLPWCSTKVDDQGQHFDLHWATCGQECPFEIGKDSYN